MSVFVVASSHRDARRYCHAVGLNSEEVTFVTSVEDLSLIGPEDDVDTTENAPSKITKALKKRFASFSAATN